jgi:hypothetical protein
MVDYLWSGFSSHDALSLPLFKSFNQFILKGCQGKDADFQ